MATTTLKTLVRHEGEAPREPQHLRVEKPVDQPGRLGCRRLGPMPSILTAHGNTTTCGSTELYYVLEGEGTVSLDGVAPVRPGSIVHIPPGVVHGARGRMKVLVVGIPDIADDDLYFPEGGAGS